MRRLPSPGSDTRGSDYMREVPVERIYRDVRVLRLYEGTSGAQRLFIGRNLMRREKPSRS
ncbi:hypothetical protein DTL70_27445 [Streptomyces diacarni]|uniref:Acyl-CoA dehydrogenase/oxidase C-terminal domain-containing protein n=1 Tax=Streptomyces diacarni TaxID=2800381 RepID=A0A367EH63_9ACTN|nr:hypothetical protein DTL70_27445 [Streptomyces diacarni]